MSARRCLPFTFSAAGTSFDGLQIATLQLTPTDGFNGSVLLDNLTVSTVATVTTSGPVYFSDQATAANNVTVHDANNNLVTGLTSHGATVEYALINSTTLVGYTGATVPTAINASNVVFSVVLSTAAANGSYNFVLDQPLDQKIAGEDNLHFTFDFTAKDFDGDTVSGTFAVSDTDDVPVVASSAAGLAGTANEGGLPSGNEPSSPTVFNGTSGSLDTLVHFGADGQNATPFQFVSNATSLVSALNIESHGVAVNFTSVASGASGTTLTANAGGANGTQVFTLTLNADGSWNVTLLAPIDHNGPQTFDLSGLVQAVDFDGDTIGLASGDLKITITDDAPITVSATGLAGTVNEGGLTNGNEFSSPTTAGGLSGSLDTLVHFGADGQNATPFQFVSNATSLLTALDITSHGVQVNYTSVTTGASGTTLTAFAGGANGTQVFTLTLNDDGSWSVTLKAPIDHNGSETFDLSSLVQAVDFDGSTVGLASGDIKITITDDAPITVSARDRLRPPSTKAAA